MKKCMDTENLHRRLRKIIGQVQAIDRMIDEDVPCEDVLSQMNAVKSAMHKCGQIVMEGHINNCVREGIEHGGTHKELLARNGFYAKIYNSQFVNTSSEQQQNYLLLSMA